MSRFATDLGQVAHDLPDALVMLEGDGTVTWMNQAAADLTGSEPVTWSGRSVFDFLHEEDHAVARGALDSVNTRSPSPRVDVAVRVGAGGWRRTGFRGRTFPGGVHGDEFVVVMLS